MCAAGVVLSCLDATSKYLSAIMDPALVAWARYASALVVTAIYIKPFSEPRVLVSRRPWLQVLRSAIMLACTITAFSVLPFVQLDQFQTIMFLQPFLITALSVPFLGEHIGWRRWTAISVGFCGVLLATRPGFSEFQPAILVALATAVLGAMLGITARILSRTDSDKTTMFYSNIGGAVCLTPILPFIWQTPESWLAVVLMAMTGVFGGIGHLLLVMAFRRAPAGVIAPYMYMQLLWATMFGYLIFGNAPTGWTIAGAAVVVVSGLYMIYRERVVGARRAPERVA